MPHPKTIRAPCIAASPRCVGPPHSIRPPPRPSVPHASQPHRDAWVHPLHPDPPQNHPCPMHRSLTAMRGSTHSIRTQPENHPCPMHRSLTAMRGSTPKPTPIPAHLWKTLSRGSHLHNSPICQLMNKIWQKNSWHLHPPPSAILEVVKEKRAPDRLTAGAFPCPPLNPLF